MAKGGPKPKFLNPADKHAVSEGENGFITFTVEGDPAPTVEWFKGFKDLSVEPRSAKHFLSHPEYLIFSQISVR